MKGRSQQTPRAQSQHAAAFSYFFLSITLPACVDTVGDRAKKSTDLGTKGPRDQKDDSHSAAEEALNESLLRLKSALE